MDTQIFKIEEEMTEKMKPKDDNSPKKNRWNSLLTICIPLMYCCLIMICIELKAKIVSCVARRLMKDNILICLVLRFIITL